MWWEDDTQMTLFIIAGILIALYLTNSFFIGKHTIFAVLHADIREYEAELATAFEEVVEQFEFTDVYKDNISKYGDRLGWGKITVWRLSLFSWHMYLFPALSIGVKK